MKSFYWAFFCLGVWGIIIWSLVSDDFADFVERTKASARKFSVRPDGDDTDAPSGVQDGGGS